MQPSQSKRKGYCEIAISPFDHAQLVHARGDGRPSQSHVVMLPSPAGNPNWIRQTASVRLSSGCAVIVAPEETSGVPLMHMLQVVRICVCYFDYHYPRASLCAIAPPRSGVLAATLEPTSLLPNLYLLLPEKVLPSCSGTRSSGARIP